MWRGCLNGVEREELGANWRFEKERFGKKQLNTNTPHSS
jgi:hypothetical protein